MVGETHKYCVWVDLQLKLFWIHGRLYPQVLVYRLVCSYRLFQIHGRLYPKNLAMGWSAAADRFGLMAGDTVHKFVCMGWSAAEIVLGSW